MFGIRGGSDECRKGGVIMGGGWDGDDGRINSRIVPKNKETDKLYIAISRIS